MVVYYIMKKVLTLIGLKENLYWTYKSLIKEDYWQWESNLDFLDETFEPYQLN